MRRIFITWLAICGVLLGAWQANAQFFNPPMYMPTKASGCSQATALIARMDGSQNTSAVTTAVCGMVTDGTYSLLDGLYVFAINSTANAALNWAQNAFNLTKTGTITFSANQGYTGDGSTGFFSTAFTPSTAGGNTTLNSVSLGSCNVNNRTTSSNQIEIGSSNNTFYSFVAPLQAGGNTVWDLNGGSFPAFANATARGSWIATRTGSVGTVLYLNGSSVATPADASALLMPFPYTIFGLNINGSVTDFSSDQLAYVFYGGGLTGTQATNIYSRLHTYLQTVGETTAC